MTDRWTPRLSEYLDGELAAPEREALEEHLAECEECAGLVDELRAVVARARALPLRKPSRDLWPGVAARIGAMPRPGDEEIRVRRGRRLSFSVPQLLAAGLLLAAVSGGAVWLALAPERGTAPRAPGLAPVPVVGVGDLGGRPYEAVVAELEAALRENRDRLSPETIRALEESLAAIDRALEDARAALAADPANVYLNSHLAETMRRKALLLSRVAALASGAS